MTNMNFENTRINNSPPPGYSTEENRPHLLELGTRQQNSPPSYKLLYPNASDFHETNSYQNVSVIHAEPHINDARLKKNTKAYLATYILVITLCSISLIVIQKINLEINSNDIYLKFCNDLKGLKLKNVIIYKFIGYIRDFRILAENPKSFFLKN